MIVINGEDYVTAKEMGSLLNPKKSAQTIVIWLKYSNLIVDLHFLLSNKNHIILTH
ncbi:MAG: hypothetical protein H7Y18_07825 [Clostridiaceae bacterium]|nr:hypothetical protein [Clostridiaceae bacterium]